MICRNSKLAWLFFNLMLALVLGCALSFGARAVLVDSTRERDRQAEQIRRFAAAALEATRGNMRQLRAWLAPLPLGASFSALEIRNKSGTVLDIRYDAPTPPAWANAFPSMAPGVLELSLDAKNSVILRLLPAPSYPASRLAEAIVPALTSGIGAIFFANLFFWKLSRRWRIAGIEQAHWERSVSLRPEPEPQADRGNVLSPADRSMPDCLERYPEAILICDSERRVRHANAAARTLFRHTPAIEPGGDVLELIAPWDRARFADTLADLDSPEGRGGTVRLQALTAHGGVCPIDVVIVPLADDGTDLILSLRDASRAQLLENDLEMRDRLLDLMPQGLAIVSSQDHGEILYCNRTFGSLLRLAVPPAQATLPGLLAVGAEDAVVRAMQAAVEKNTPRNLSFAWRTGGGAAARLELRLAPLSPDPNGSPLLTVMLSDRTEEAAARDRIERELAFKRGVLEDMPLGFCVVDTEGKVLSVNTRLVELTGLTRDSLIGSSVDEWLAWDPKTKGHRPHGELTTTIKGASKTFKVSTLASPTAADKGEYVYFLDDVTQFRQQAQAVAEEAERLQLTLESITDGVIATNRDGFIQYLNPQAKRLTGLDGQDYVGLPIGKVLYLMDEKKRRPLADPVLRAMRIGKAVKFRHDVLLLGEGKPELAVDVSATPIFDKKRTLIGGVVVLKDISEQRSLAQQMKMRASRDPLTGLVNRRELVSLLESLQYEVDEYHRLHSLCYMDLDKFKIVNDTCGHPAGDELLRQIAHLMGQCLRTQDILARIGGDEFCAVLPNTGAEDAKGVAERIRESVKAFRFTWDGKYFELGISIGIVEIAPGIGVEQNLSAADKAGYVAKERGRDQVYIAEREEPEFGKSLLMPWNERLLEALEHDYFRFSVREARFLRGDIRSAPSYREFQLQLCEPDQTPIAASAFMPNVRRFDLVPAIERWAISKLFSFRSPVSGPADSLSVCSIPISAITLSEDGFVPFLLEQSAAYQVSPSRICFEIAESDFVQNYTAVRHLISKCKEQGYRFCLGQFGGGFSSFAYVRNLPLDFFKIDVSLTHRIEIDPIDEAIVRAIQNIAEQMNILTIAQDVSSPTLLERLRDLGIHYAQGLAVEPPSARSVLPAQGVSVPCT